MGRLDPWFALHNNVATIRMSTFGDSTTVGDINTTIGGWPEQIRQLAATRWGNGGDGFHYNTRNWTYTTAGNAWTNSTTSDAWDSGIFQAGTKLANGSAKVATWTKPAALTVASFEIVIVDGATSANFAYRIDGGAWTDTTFTLAQNNGQKRLRVNSPITSTLDVRGANAAGTGVNCYLLGMMPYTKSPGLIIDNVSLDGQLLQFQERTTSGQAHAYISDMQPKLATVMFTNDVISGFWNQSTYQTNMQNFCDAITAQGGSVLFINYFEQQRSAPDGGTVNQAQLRAATKAAAVAKGMPCLDLYDLVGDNAAAQAAGYMDSNPLHATDAGCAFIAQQVWKLIASSGRGWKAKAA